LCVDDDASAKFEVLFFGFHSCLFSDINAYNPSYLTDGGLDPILLGAVLQPMQSIDIGVADVYRRNALGMLRLSYLIFCNIPIFK
jgi:hypothetical protein